MREVGKVIRGPRGKREGRKNGEDTGEKIKSD